MKGSERYLLKVFTTISGIAFILLGISIYRKGIISEWTIFVELAEDSNRIYYLILFVPIGIFLIPYGLKSKAGVYQADIYLACESCAKVMIKENREPIKCSECGGDLELLEDFYERHQEHK